VPTSKYKEIICKTNVNKLKLLTILVRQSDLYSEHAYWKATSVPALDPFHSSTTIKVEVPKELPKVSMVYTSLKELKRYLTSFDLVVKERTTTTGCRTTSLGVQNF
ncbi:hypothetical protein Tco_0495165, partial [Tanacetum coccineum]